MTWSANCQLKSNFLKDTYFKLSLPWAPTNDTYSLRKLNAYVLVCLSTFNSKTLIFTMVKNHRYYDLAFLVKQCLPKKNSNNLRYLLTDLSSYFSQRLSWWQGDCMAFPAGLQCAFSVSFLNSDSILIHKLSMYCQCYFSYQIQDWNQWCDEWRFFLWWKLICVQTFKLATFDL